MSNATVLKTHQNAPQAQIGDEAMADAVQLVKTLETPYLRDLRRLIDGEIITREKSKITDAMVQIQQIANGVGLSVEQLMNGALAKPRKAGSNAGIKHGPASIKYRHPEDASLTWAGRGRSPKWVMDWENSGKSIIDLLIDKA